MAKDLMAIKKLESGIKKLKNDPNPLKYENTLIRAGAILSNLKDGISQKKIAESIGLSEKAVGNWIRKYKKDEKEGKDGLEELKKINHLKVSRNKRDTSNDNELLITIRKELKELKTTTESNEFKNTKIRARAIKYYLKHKGEGKTQQDVADMVGCDATSINNWLLKYTKDKMEGLKELDKIPITKIKRDISNYPELLASINEEIKELEKNPLVYVNTQIRAKAVRDYLMPGETLRGVAAEINSSESQIKSWLDIYIAKKMDGLKDIDNYPLHHNLRNTLNDTELLDEINKEISKLKTKDSELDNEILKMAEPVRDYLTNKGTQTLKQIAKANNVHHKVFQNWLKEFTENRINGLKDIALQNISRQKKSNANNNLDRMHIAQMPNGEENNRNRRKHVDNNRKKKAPKNRRIT